MRNLAILVFCFGAAAFGQGSPIPTLATSVEPRVVKPGMVITIRGEALSRAHVDQVYLTDHRFDQQMKVLEQTDQVVKVRIPQFAKAGRQQVLLLTSGERAAYLEMPLYVLIEADDEDTLTASAPPATSTNQ